MGTPRDRTTPRALLGAALVVAAVVGTYALATGTQDTPTTVVWVAARDLTVGHTVGPDDLTTARVAADPALDPTYSDEPEPTGRRLLAPLNAGDPLLATALGDTTTEPDRPELTLAIPRERALDGRLRTGDRVDVVATYGTGDTAVTRLAARDVPVGAVRADDDLSLGSSPVVAVTLHPADRAETLRIAHALDAATLTLVRATPADRDATPGTDPAAEDEPSAPGGPLPTYAPATSRPDDRTAP